MSGVEQPPALNLPDGWTEHENAHGELYCTVGDLPEIVVNGNGIEWYDHLGATAAEARSFAARLDEAAGIVEQLRAGAR